MPGFIKVSGQQRPLAVPYVKVSGTWTPAALSYVKVDGEWKIWYSAEIKDDFNRADNASLGTASNNFSLWTELSGSWEIRNNQAYHPTSTGVSIATTPLYRANTDVTVELDIPSGTGLGVAFWVQDSAKWYAAIPGRRVQNNPAFYSCPSGYNLEGTRCTRTVTYSATYEPPSTQTIYFCPSGYYDTGSGCAYDLSPSYYTDCRGIGCRGEGGCASAGGDCQYSQVCADGGFGPCNCVICTEQCVCLPNGGSCSNCSGSVTTGYQTDTVTTPGGYTCPSGGTLNGTTCTRNDNIAATYNPPTTTYPSVIRIFNSISNLVGLLFERDISTDPKSIQVKAVGNNVQVRLYSQAQAQGTPYASVSYTANNPTKTTTVGLAKIGNEPDGQGFAVDNFRAE